jgi:8-oxo-dGTP pyrophosphatase MutT (NUDIX family)
MAYKQAVFFLQRRAPNPSCLARIPPTQYNTGMPSLSTSTIEVLLVRRDQTRPLYFLAHRAAGSPRSGYWTLLSGAVRSGESATRAAARLISEQTGLQAQALYAVDSVHTYYDAEDDTIRLAPIILAEVEQTGSALAAEYDEGRWINKDLAHDLLARPEEQTALAHIHEHIVLAPDRGAGFRVPLDG